jgi:hypothetical protein
VNVTWFVIGVLSTLTCIAWGVIDARRERAGAYDHEEEL